MSWRDKVSNTTVLDLSKSAKMYTILRIRCLRWAGHVGRMEDSRLPKGICYGQLANAERPVRGPKLSFRDIIKRDEIAFDLPVDRWKEIAKYRSQWKTLVSKGRRSSESAHESFCNGRRDRRRHPSRH